ncbi:MAG: calcium-binding protein [Microcoleus vaginatus WJT46-NPBG5]|jgi:Ca2+-binding RTX toxin-like protein|nr:calcium-binding protein [Microcoleus vaginatus WJT46-NPBG5]
MSIITVTTNANSGVGSLRAAITSANAGDTIQFSSSLANQTISLSSQIEINKHLTIDGAGATNLTISGNNASRVFYSDWSYLVPEGYNISLKNLTIANGKTTDTDGGAGIRMGYLGTLTVENIEFKNNSAMKGAAIMAGTSGKTTVINSKFDANNGTLGTTDVIRERGSGGIATVGGDLVVKGSQFTNNKGIVGGAINVLNTELLVESSSFVNNDTTAGAGYPAGRYQSGNGGAIYTDGANGLNEAGNIIIRKSRFEGNKAAGFGGALNLSAYQPQKVSVEDSTILGNQVIKNSNGSSLGGGIYHQDVELTVKNTTVANNKAVFQGGGLWANNAQVAISNSTFSGNIAEDAAKGYGGAIRIGGTDKAANITNTTIANNSAGWVGGGILAGSNPITVKNTIFSNNTATNPWKIQYNTTRQLTDGGGNIQWPPKATNLSNDYNATASVTLADPKLGALQDNGGGVLTHALLSGSAAIDKGINTGAPTTDQRGELRPKDGDGNGSAIVDSGAFELGTTTTVTSNDTLVGTAGNDVLNGNDGDDSLDGAGGNDTLYGGIGADKLFGQAGTDILDGGDGNDVLNGGADSDTLTGGLGADSLVGGAGNDSLVGGDGNDTLDGGTENDKLNGGTGNDLLYGGIGTDSLDGGSGSDKLYGQDANDTLTGSSGNDSLYGGAGNDILTGVSASATVPGIGEVDRLWGEAGGDTFVLGNTTKVFYDNTGTATQGLSDYAILADFNRSEDFIQLKGSAANYQLVQSSSGTQIFYGSSSTKDELIGLVQGDTSGLTLTSTNFKYV